MNRSEMKIYFDWLDGQCRRDGKITLDELKKSVAVDLDGNGKIEGDKELAIVQKNIARWIENAGDKLDDKVLTFDELCEMLL